MQQYEVVPVYAEAIAKVLVEDNKLHAEEHVSSGRISAGMMGKTSLECVLKLIGVPGKEFDAYTLGKFARGNQAEDWFVEHIKKAVDHAFTAQVELSYRGGIGFADLVHTAPAENDTIVRIPHEVKSVSNRAFKYIAEPWKTGADGKKHKGSPEPNLGHVYQATFYGLALEAPYFYIHYVAADDLRVLTLRVQTSQASGHVNAHIDAIEKSLKTGKLPDYEGFLQWHGMADYSDYPEFVGCTGEEAEFLLARDYPEALKKLKGKK